MSDPTSHDHQDSSVRSNGRSGTPEETGAPSSPPASVRPPGPIYSPRFKIVVAVAIAACVAAVAFAYVRTTDGNGRSPSSGAAGQSASYPGVERIYPSDGSQVLQQETVGVDLVPGWNGTLTIDDRAIPEDDLTRSSPRQTADSLAFAPGPDKVIGVLPGGRVCARAEVWRRARGPEGGTETVDWCFHVL